MNGFQSIPVSLADDQQWARVVHERAVERLASAYHAIGLVTFAGEDYIQFRAELAFKRRRAANGMPEHFLTHLDEPESRLEGVMSLGFAKRAMETAAVNFLHAAIEDTLHSCMRRLTKRRHPWVVGQLRKRSIEVSNVLDARWEHAIDEMLDKLAEDFERGSIVKKYKHLLGFLNPLALPDLETVLKFLDPVRNNAIHGDGARLEEYFHSRKFDLAMDPVYQGISSILGRLVEVLHPVPRSEMNQSANP